MNNFVTRTISGVVFVLLLLAGIMLHPFGFAALMMFIVIMGTRELYAMFPPGRLAAWGYATGILLFVLFFARGFGLVPAQAFMITVLPVAAVFVAALYTKSPTPSTDIALTLLAPIYVALPFSLMNVLTLHDGNYDFRLLLSFFIFLWANDVGAYCFGMLFGRHGRHKLFERISPKKSWEGFFGGLVAAMVAGYILSAIWSARYGMAWPHWLAFAAIVSVAGTFGDLAESMFKRSAGVKDSGNIMPGHGGILDRFDGALLALPCALAYLELVRVLA